MKSVALVVLTVVLFGCRPMDQVAPSTPPVPPQLRFKPGDYFSYTTWDLDDFGNVIDRSKSRTSWTVADTGRLARGFLGVTVFVDSVFRKNIRFADSLAYVDSIYIRVASNGDIFQFGFVANLIQKREHAALPSQWDRIAAFSLQSGTSWVIGLGDPGGNSVVSGRIAVDQEYLGVTVNGVSGVELAYRIDITKPDLGYTYWVTDLPFGFMRFRDESTEVANGSLQDITLVKGEGL